MPTRGTGRRTLPAPALLLAVTMMLAGCTDGDDATPTPTATVAATPSPTPSPTPEGPTLPTRPEAMATNDEAGAVALAQYFIADLYPYTFASGDKTEWSQLSDDGCNFCNSIIEILDEMALAGETSVADPTVVESVDSVTLVEGSRYAVTLQVLQGESRRISRSGEEVGISDAGRYTVNYAIQWSEGWSVLAVDATPLAADGT